MKNTKKRTSVLIDGSLLKRVRKALRASTDTDAITKPLQEVLANKEIAGALRDLIRKGRARFVDVYRERLCPFYLTPTSTSLPPSLRYTTFSPKVLPPTSRRMLIKQALCPSLSSSRSAPSDKLTLFR